MSASRAAVAAPPPPGGIAAPVLHRRRTELGLIVVVVIITGGAYTLASLGKAATIPANIGPFLGIILGLLVIAHLAVRRLAPNADSMLLPLAGLLNGVGYVFIARLNSKLAGLQATWTVLGVVGFVVTLAVVRRARDLARYQYTLGVVGMVLLLSPLLPGIGRNINGNRIWLRLGPASFQPGEAAKIALAVFFAAYIVEHRDLLALTRKVGPVRLPVVRLRVIGPIAVAWGVSLLVIVAERDLGSALLVFALFVTMLWVATARTTYLVTGLGLFLAGAFFAWRTLGHVHDRVQIWLNPWPVAANKGYQIVQAAYAFGSGGVTGSGLGLGSPQKIPAVQTDFIIAAIGEELGLLGTTAILVAFLLMVGAGIRIALRVEHPFEKLLTAGLTAVIGIQTFIIIGGVTRLVPLTGITLPFVSYGGSSLLTNYVLLALLLRISHEGATVELRPDT